MADIATLGLKIDSSQATSAVKELDRLTAAGKKAEDATKGLGKAAGPGLGAVEAAAKRAGISVEDMQARMAKASESVARHFPQIGKNATEAAKGVTTLAEAVGAGGGAGGGVAPAMDRAEKSSRNFADTLTRRFVVAYAISQIRTLVAAVGGLNAELAQISDVGRLTGFGSQGVQGIIGSAGNKGISSNAISGALVAFNQQIPLAKAGVGSLGELLRGNRVTVTDTADAFFKVADLVKNASNETARLSILQQAGLPATMEMARYMGQGADALRQQAAAAPKIADAQIEAARRIQDRYNELYTNLEREGKRVSVEVADGWIAAWQRPFMDPSTLLGGWLQKAKGMVTGNPLAGGTQLTQDGANSFYDATGADRPTRPVVTINKTPTRDVATLKAIQQETIQRASVRIGLVGKTPTAAEIKRSKEPKAQNDNDRNQHLHLKAA